MQIRCLHNAISLEVTKAPGIKKPHIVVVQSFAVFLLGAEHFDVLTYLSLVNAPTFLERIYSKPLSKGSEATMFLLPLNHFSLLSHSWQYFS